MGKFHQATKTDITMIAKMMATSFATYPFVAKFLTTAYASEKRRTQFLEKVSRILIKTLMRKGVCLFDKEDDEVRSFCVLSTIENMNPSIWDMVASGVLHLLPNLLNKAVRQFIVFYLRDAAMVNFPKSADRWYVHLFAVNPGYQGKRLGSAMMNHCIFPYVEQRQGQSILLATNTEPALKFYTNNGFEVIAQDKISYRGEVYTKWDLCKTITSGGITQ